MSYSGQESTTLQAILEELSGTQKLRNIPRRIELCQHALRLLDCSKQPQLWAATQVKLGNSLAQSSLGDRRQNVEEAIACYEQALTVFTQDTMPVNWATTMNNLATAYTDRICGNRGQNLEKAIACYQQALTVRTQQARPVQWATTMMNLGNAYRNRIRGDQAQNVEEAIACYEQALTVFTQDAMPVNWATTMNNLALAYADRIYGNRGQNLEEAIACYQQALTVRTQQAMPVDWATTMMNLALAYADRICGNRGQNLEEAIACYQQALTVFAQDAMPVDWARTMMNLALAYRNRIHGEQAQNLEEAITCHQQALTVFTQDAMPIDWATTMMNLGNAYRNRIRGEQAQNLEEAIACSRQALTVFTQDAIPVQWAGTMNNLAIAYANRIRGERGQNLEEAIACYRQALTVMTQQAMPGDWARTMSNLATVYYSRIHGDRTQNLEEAIACHQQALTVFTQDAILVQWARTMMNLATAYTDRIRGEQAQNLEEAIVCYQQALTVFTRDAIPVQWATTIMNLGIAYRNRIRGDRGQNLEEAIACYQQALTVFTQDAMPVDWARTMMNLALVYGNRIRGERGQNLEEAIVCYQQALTVRTQGAMPVQWATTMMNLGIAYRNRIRGEHGQNLEEAIACYRQALTVFTQDAMPADHRQIQRNLGILALAEHQWHTAVHAFREALAAGELLYAIASTPEARQVELRKVGGLSASCAYALVCQAADDSTALTKSVVTLERNRARWLAESLALRSVQPAAVPTALWKRFTATAAQIRQLQSEAQLPDDTPGKRAFLKLSELLTTERTELTQVIEEIRVYAPEFMPAPSFADIQRAFATTEGAEAEVAVYLLTTSQGGLALLLHAHDVIPIWLDSFTDATSRTLLRSWFDAYNDFLREQRDSERTRWFEQVEGVTGQLWTLAMGPVAAALGDLDLPSHTREQPKVVTLIPLGLMALLPLHAAWTADSNTPTSRRYFLDDYAVRYAPSATALRHSRERVGDVSVELLALDEPKPIRGAGPLPNAAREVKAIACLFPAPTVLQHEQASREATLDMMAATQVAHFSCHGTNNWQNPLDSGLLLANDERLTVRDFLELHLPNARLATLSACETGIVGTDLPDEVVMLPSALVQAGYAGVIASLWSVADVSTAMLMVRFYQYWREEGLEPVYALRAAQRWVRDTTNGEKAAYFGQFVPSPENRMAGTVAAEFFNTAMLSTDGLEARSFAHPFWWGAFYLTGV